MSPIWVILFVVVFGFWFFGNGGLEFEFGMGNFFWPLLFIFWSLFPLLAAVCHHPLLQEIQEPAPPPAATSRP